MAVTTEASPTARALRVLSLALGTFLFAMGMKKIGWLLDSGALRETLLGWLADAPAASRWYLATIAIPLAPVFAPLVALGELSAGAALVCGVRVRLAAAAGFLMILNFHFAVGVIFRAGYLTNGFCLPVMGSLLALALADAELPFSLRWPVARRASQNA